MSSQNEPDNPINWLELLTNTAGFAWGFFCGGLTGYFGNWLWDKYRPKKKDGHLHVETDGAGTNFRGRLTPDNKEQILKTLKATATPTTSSRTYSRTSTGSSGTSNRGKSNP